MSTRTPRRPADTLAAVKCIRKPASTYTECPCPDCRADQRRKAKMLRSGIQPVTDRRDAARRRLKTWMHLGYSSGVIASLTGNSLPATRRVLAKIRTGHEPRMNHESARRILAAPDLPVGTRGHISAIGSNRRLQALTAMGWTLRALSDHSGVSHQTLSDLRGSDHSMTTPKFAAEIRRLYDELSMIPGISDAARRCAARNGWHGPLAWDDDTIDDPAATPDLGAETPRPTGGQGRPVADLVEDITWLLQHDSSLTAGQLAERFGYADRSAIQIALARHGYRDLLNRLNLNQERAA